MKGYGEIIGDCLIIALGAIVTYIFVLIALAGSYYAYEPSPLILWGEIGTGVLIIGFGIYKFIEDAKRK